MDTMTTVSEVLNNLKKKGYTVDFNINNNCLVCHGNQLEIYPDDFIVDKHYRFEGISDPADEAVVYAISSDKHNVKGTLVNGYGIYSEELTDDLLKKLKTYDLKPSESAERKIDKDTTSRQSKDISVENTSHAVLNLSTLIEQIKSNPTWKTNDRGVLAAYKSDEVKIVLYALHEGAELKEHTAPGNICVQVLEGQIEFTTEQRAHRLSKGQLLTLKAKIPHSVIALEEAVFMLTITSTLEK